jgi:hypothetical protein
MQYRTAHLLYRQPQQRPHTQVLNRRTWFWFPLSGQRLSAKRLISHGIHRLHFHYAISQHSVQKPIYIYGNILPDFYRQRIVEMLQAPASHNFQTPLR